MIFANTPLLALLLTSDVKLGLQTYISELGKDTIVFLIVKIPVLWNLRFYKVYWGYARLKN